MWDATTPHAHTTPVGGVGGVGQVGWGSGRSKPTRNFLQGGRAMSNQTEPAKVCKLLPAEARDRLIRAAKTPIPPGDPLARQRAIEAAALMAQLVRPALFRR